MGSFYHMPKNAGNPARTRVFGTSARSRITSFNVALCAFAGVITPAPRPPYRLSLRPPPPRRETHTREALESRLSRPCRAEGYRAFRPAGALSGPSRNRRPLSRGHRPHTLISGSAQKEPLRGPATGAPSPTRRSPHPAVDVLDYTLSASSTICETISAIPNLSKSARRASAFGHFGCGRSGSDLFDPSRRNSLASNFN